MKHLVLAFIFLVAALSLSAQTEQGGGFVGGNVNLAFSSYKGTSTTRFNFGLNPTGGFFVAKNFAIGLFLNYSLDYATASSTVAGVKQTNTSSIHNFGFGPVFRPYIKIGERSRLFFDGRIGGGSTIYNSNTGGNKSTTNIGYIGGSIAPGIAVFFTRNVALEFMAGYYGEKQLPRANAIVPYPVTHRIFLGLGLQVYISKRKVEQVPAEIPR
jgi:hypothetical protein